MSICGKQFLSHIHNNLQFHFLFSLRFVISPLKENDNKNILILILSMQIFLGQDIRYTITGRHAAKNLCCPEKGTERGSKVDVVDKELTLCADYIIVYVYTYQIYIFVRRT